MVVGTLLVGKRLDEASTFDEGDLKLLEMLANHASVAIHNAQLVSELEESLAHMTELKRLKDDFVATVSHELRTPLKSVQGFVKTLLRSDVRFDPVDQRSHLEIVERQGERLGRLIEDLLVVARIEVEPIETTPSTVGLADCARHAITELRVTAPDRSINVVFDEAVPDVQTDGEKVRRILSKPARERHESRHRIRRSPSRAASKPPALSSPLTRVEERGIGIRRNPPNGSSTASIRSISRLRASPVARGSPCISAGALRRRAAVAGALGPRG